MLYLKLHNIFVTETNPETFCKVCLLTFGYKGKELTEDGLHIYVSMNHVDDCYFWLTTLIKSGLIKKRRKVQYPNLSFAILQFHLNIMRVEEWIKTVWIKEEEEANILSPTHDPDFEKKGNASHRLSQAGLSDPAWDFKLFKKEF